MKSYLNKMMALVVAFVMVISCMSFSGTTVLAASDTGQKSVRVVVDGEACTVTGYYVDESLWVSENDVLLLTGVCPADYTRELNGEVYYNLAAASHEAGFGYYSYDTVLDAVYMWSKDRYSKETYDVAKIMARKEITKNLDYYDADTSDKTTITVAQYMTLLDRMVAYADKDRVAEWKEMYSSFRDNTDEMIKAQGMYLLLYAGEFLGGDYMELGEYDSYRAYDEKMQNAGDGMKKYDPGALFEDKGENVTFNDGTKWNREVGAYFYGIGRTVAATGEMVAGYDEANTAIHADLPLTVKDAVDMVVRNIEASGNLRRENGISEEELHYVDYDEAVFSVLPDNAIPQKLLEQWEQDGVDHADDYETGFALSASASEPVNYVNDMRAEDIRHIAEWGFNKVRLNAGFVHFFKEDMSQVCTEAMEKLDELVAAGIRYHVKIEICLDEFPGWYTKMGSDYKYYGSVDFITNAEHREQAKSILRMLTKRYQSVPKDALSICPFVEYGNWTRTNAMDFLDQVPSYTDEQIADALMELADAVKEIDPDREIFMETEELGTKYKESNSLATTKAREKGVLFTGNVASNYIYDGYEETDDRVWSHFLQDWPYTRYAGQNWIIGVGNNRKDEAVPLTLQGDLKAGSSFDLYLQQVGGAGTVKVLADGEVIKEETLDPENDKLATAVEYGYEYDLIENGKNIIHDYCTSTKSISFALEKDAQTIQISYDLPEENEYRAILWSGLCVTFPQEYTKDRWFYVTEYDAAAHPDFYGDKAGYQVEKSSKLYIGNTTVESEVDEDGTWKVQPVPYTISSDLTYKTDYTEAQYDKESMETFASNFRKKAEDKKATMRFETLFSGGLGSGYRAYYSDMLDAFRENNVGWLSNDFGTTLIQKQTIETRLLAGDEYIPYYEYEQFDPLVMEVFQKYQKAADDLEENGGHVWGTGTVTKEASCSQTGEMTYTCTLCKKVKTVTTLKNNKHNETEIRNKKAATETEEGYTGDTYCKKCGALIEKGKAIDKLPSKSSETENPTTTEKDTTSKTEDAATTEKDTTSKTEDAATTEKDTTSKTEDAATTEKDTAFKAKKLVSSLKLTGISKKIAAGKKLKLVPSFTPADAENQELVWTSSNKEYATVSSNGVVTTKSKGAGKSVVIQAATKDGSNIKATYKIKIVKHAVKSIKLTAKSKKVKAGKKLSLKAKVKTTGKTANKTLQWSSSNTKYATVSKKGVVSTKKAGKGKTVKITAMATDGSGKKATVKIKITR